MIRPLLMAASAMSISCTLAQADPQIQNCAIDTETDAPCPAPDAASTRLVGGQIVFIDPETGEIVSGETATARMPDDTMATMRRELSEQLRQSFTVGDLSEARTETGAIALDLQGRFQNPVIAIIQPDGTLRVGHVNAAGGLD